MSRPASSPLHALMPSDIGTARDTTPATSPHRGALPPTPWWEPLVTTRELAALWGQTPRWVLRMANDHGLPHYRLGGAIRYRASDAEAWLQERRQTAYPGAAQEARQKPRAA